MKKLLQLCLLIGLQQQLKAQFYYQNFDGFDTNPNNSLFVHLDTLSGNIWQIGKPQKTLFNSAYTGTKVIVTDTLNSYPVNNVSRFTFAFTHYSFMNPFSPMAIQWTQKLDLEPGADGAIVEFSTDSVNWQNAHNNPNVYQFYGFDPMNKDTLSSGEYAFSGTDNNWRDVWMCLSPGVHQQNDTVFFRFTLKSDGNHTNQEGWIIDNINAHMTIIHPVKETSQIDNIVVYPNVTSGIVNVEMKKINNTDMIDNIEVLDESGRVIEAYGKNYTKVVLDIRKHKPGLYYFRVTTNNKPKLFKVVYEKN